MLLRWFYTSAVGPERDLPQMVHGQRVRVSGVPRVARAQRHAGQVAQLLVQAQPHYADGLVKIETSTL